MFCLLYMFPSGLFDTILLEVLLVRSVPCRLGISSDMALSCCRSFANLLKKFEYSKQCVQQFIAQISLRVRGLLVRFSNVHDGEDNTDLPRGNK